MLTFAAPSAIVENLGWVLIHSLWQFVLVAGGLAALLACISQRRAGLRYGLGIVAMCCVTLLPIVTWSWLPAREVPQLARSAASLEVGSATPAENLRPVQPLDVLPASPTAQITILPAAADRAANVAAASWSERAFATWMAVEQRLRPWLATLVVLWCLGVCSCACRPLCGWYTVRRLRRVGLTPVSEQLDSLFQRLCSRLKIRQTVQLSQSALVNAPMLVGYLRPLILLPATLITELPLSQLEALLAHELAHVRRHDALVNLLQTFAETLYFYHPAVWWIGRLIRDERENCCDDLALDVVGNLQDYGRALLALEERRGVTPALVLGARGGSLVTRVRRLVSGVSRKREVDLTWPAGATVAVLLLGLGWAWSWNRSAAQEPATPAAVETKPTASPKTQSADQQKPKADTGSIVGRVIDADGAPVAKVLVACGPVWSKTTTGGANSLTDETGTYRLTGLQPGVYNVWLKNFAADPKQVVIADDGIRVEAGKESTSGLRIMVGRKVAGRLIDAEQKPVAGAKIGCYSSARPISGGTVQSVETSDKGEFEFLLPPGRAHLYLMQPLFQNQKLSASADVQVPVKDEVPEVVLELKPSDAKFGSTEWLTRSTPGTKVLRQANQADVSGRVVDQFGRPVEDAMLVKTEGQPEFTNPAGEFRFPIDRGTQFVFYAYAPGFHVWFGTPTAGDELLIVLEPKELVALPAADQQGANDREHSDEYVYRCDITDEKTGQGIPGAKVVWRLERVVASPGEDRTGWQQEVVSDADGKYSITLPRAPLATAGQIMWIVASHPDYLPIRNLGYPFFTPSRPLGGDGRQPDHRHLKLRPGVAVTGRLVLPDGSPAAGVPLMVGRNREGFGDGDGMGIYATTDADGRFRLVTRNEWPQRLHWFPSDYISDSKALTEKFGDQGTIRLKKGSYIAGKVVDRQGQPLPGLTIRAVTGTRAPILFTTTQDDGTFQFSPSPAGEYRIQPVKHFLDHRLGQWRITPLPVPFTSQSATLAATEPSQVLIEAPETGVIQVLVVDAAGKPAANRTLTIGEYEDAIYSQPIASKPGHYEIVVPKDLASNLLKLHLNSGEAALYQQRVGDPLVPGSGIVLQRKGQDLTEVIVRTVRAGSIEIKVTTSDNQNLGFQYLLDAEYLRREEFQQQHIYGASFMQLGYDGARHLEQVVPGEDVVLTVSAEGYKAETITTRVEAGEKQTVEFHLQSTKTDAKQAALQIHCDIAGADTLTTIELQPIVAAGDTQPESENPILQQTLKNGTTFLFEKLRPGKYQVARLRTLEIGRTDTSRIATGLRLDRQVLELKAGQTSKIEFVRPQGRSITGRVFLPLDARMSHAIAQVHSEQAAEKDLPDRQQDQLFDAQPVTLDKTFTTEPLQPGRYVLLVEGYAPLTNADLSGAGIYGPRFVGRVPFEVTAEGKLPDLQIALWPLAADVKSDLPFIERVQQSIRFSVLESSGKEAVKTFTVIPGRRSLTGDHDQPVWNRAAARKGENGDYLWPLAEIPPGESAFLVEAEGREPQFWTWIDPAQGLQHVVFLMQKSPPKKDTPADPPKQPAQPPVDAVPQPNDQNAKPQDEQVLQSGLTVRVTPLDAVTRRPVTKFTIVPTPYNERVDHVTWQSQYLKEYAAENGLFRMERGWEQTLLRIEAPGYRPSVTKPLPRDVGQQNLEVELQPDAGITGRVLSPDQSPAEGAQIAVCTWTNEVTVSQGQLKYGHHADRLRKLATTAADGTFQVPAEVDEWVLVIAHSSGYAEATANEFAKSSTIQLKPWGRIEGEYIIAGQPQAHQPIDVNAGRGDVDVVLHYHGGTVETDDKGQFVFEQLPPVSLYVATLFQHGDKRFNLLWFSGLTRIQPGETTRLKFPRDGQPLQAQIILPADSPWKLSDLDLEVSLSLRPPRISGFREEVNQEWEAYSEFLKTPIGQVFQRPRIPVNADGTFRVEDLPETEYILHVSAFLNADNAKDGERKSVANYAQRVTVGPLANKAQPTDLGHLTLSVRPAESSK